MRPLVISMPNIPSSLQPDSGSQYVPVRPCSGIARLWPGQRPNPEPSTNFGLPSATHQHTDKGEKLQGTTQDLGGGSSVGDGGEDEGGEMETGGGYAVGI